jgi:hypothetical protein
MRAPGLVVAFLPLLAGCDRAPRGAAASVPSAASHPVPSTVPTDVTLPATRATTPLGRGLLIPPLAAALAA